MKTMKTIQTKKTMKWEGYAQCTHGADEATQVAFTVLFMYSHTGSTPLLCTDARSVASQPHLMSSLHIENGDELSGIQCHWHDGIVMLCRLIHFIC